MNANPKISPTAWTVAHGRTFSDIPFSKEIFDEVQRIGVEGVNDETMEELTSVDLAPRFEARYKMINRLVRETKLRQVLEVASGLTPRGMEMTENGEVDTYIEMDLPGIMRTKREIVEAILKNSRREKLFLEEGSALELEDMQTATSDFDSAKPIAVIMEGFLRYLDFNTKTVVAKNTLSLLKHFGGVWITTDITLKSTRRHEREAARRGYVKERAGIDMEENKFESTDAAAEFFEKLGFAVERHVLGEVVDKLVSPVRLNLSVSEIRERLSKSSAFVMRPR